jgi:hypothetical protein
VGGGGGGFRNGGGGYRRGGGGYYRRGYGGSAFFYGPGFGFYDPWYDPFWPYAYPYSYYAYAPRRTIIREVPVPAEDLLPPNMPAPAQNWYYCDDPQGYYPYVMSCSHEWQPVPATPPPGGPPTVSPNENPPPAPLTGGERG